MVSSSKKGFVMSLNYVVLFIIVLIVIFGLIVLLTHVNSSFLNSINSILKGCSSATSSNTTSSKKEIWKFW